MSLRPDISVQLGNNARKIKAIVDPLMLTDDQVHRVMQTLQNEMWLGFSKDPEKRAKTSLQMENTYVRSLLDGTENGDFLALDLGGTNFRVLLCKMRDGKCESISRNYNVPKAKLYGPSIGVFDHLAESIALFLQEENMMHTHLPLGFTFSFPMEQKGIKHGVLVTWTKSFKCTDGVGEDAVKHLEEAIARRGKVNRVPSGMHAKDMGISFYTLPFWHNHHKVKVKDINVDVVAVLNDTTGTLLAGSYLDHDCGIGLIMGTGCNAAYVEKISNIDKWEGDDEDPREVVIDIEWGAFGDNGSLDFTKTEFDQVIDQHSNHVGSFTFEKLFAGHYMGDLVRLVLVKLAQECLVFSGTAPTKLHQWGTLTANHVSLIESETENDAANIKKVLEDLDLGSVTQDDITVLRYVCAAISVRASQFVAATISVLLNHMARPKNTVAIDGSLYRYNPVIHHTMIELIGKLAPNTECKLILAEDGSGRGAAFVAAVAVKQAMDQRYS